MHDDVDKVFEDDENENGDKTSIHRYGYLNLNCCRYN